MTKRVRFIFMDRWGLPSNGDETTVAIVRIERQARLKWRWQVMSSHQIETPRGPRNVVTTHQSQGFGITRMHAAFQASSRVKALHYDKEK